MNKIVISFVIFATVLSTSAFAEKISEFAITTEKGRVLKCSMVRFGHFKLLSKGEKAKSSRISRPSPHYWDDQAKWKLIKTTLIPRREGDSFGVEFLLPRIGKGDVLILKAVVEAPAKKGPPKRIEADYQYRPKESNLMRNIRWSFDSSDGKNPDIAKEGRFKFSLYNKGKLLFSRTFQVTCQ